MLNVAVEIRKFNRPHCLEQAKLIFAADNRKQAVGRFREWESRWSVEEERAVKRTKKNLFNCLHYCGFDKELWASTRTNIFDRALREVRRRNSPMNNFPTNETNPNRIIYGTSEKLNRNWKGNTIKLSSTNQ